MEFRISIIPGQNISSGLSKALLGLTMVSGRDAQNMMNYEEKRALVLETYRSAHPRAKEGFYECADGYLKSRNPTFRAKTEEELVDKLYRHYFDHSLTKEYQLWVADRLELVKAGVLAAKTVQEDAIIWRNVLSKEPIATKEVSDITPFEVMEMFKRWTGPGLITRKQFNNRKSVLNGIMSQSVLDGLIPANPIPSLSLTRLRFRPREKRSNRAYSVEERRKLLDYLSEIKQDGYTLAIRLAFHGTFRIGEIKNLKKDSIDGDLVWIETQLVEEHKMSFDGEKVVMGGRVRREKLPKGNPEFSVRSQVITPAVREILDEALELAPDDTDLLFTLNGRPLTTDTMNRRLKKYTAACGIRYLSSHKIRFTSASMLAQLGNMSEVDLRDTLGHSNVEMTRHYTQQRIRKPDLSAVAAVLG